MASVSLDSVLNKAVIDYVCLCIEAGDMASLHEMGLGHDEISQLNGLRAVDLSRLTTTKAHFLDITVHRERFYNVVSQLHRNRSIEDNVDELIRRGAPLPMMSSLFAVSALTFAAKRKMFGLGDEGVGRTAEANEDELEKIYRYYQKQNKPAEEFSAIEWLILSDETNTTLRTIWQVIQRAQLSANKSGGLQ